MNKQEIGQTIRQPATANLMLDSADRNTSQYPSANSFFISKNQSILNGFFHRIGATEMVLEWNTPNIRTGVNNTITLTYLATPYTVTFEEGFWTVEEIIDALLAALDSPLIAGLEPWTLTQVGYGVQLSPTGVPLGDDITITGTLAGQLGLLGSGVDGLIEFPKVKADLRPYRYLDFVSSQLTYNQELKDAATNSVVRDVLLRWYFAYDNEPILDGYGFPILMGYTPFTLRRIYSPPKQIKWDMIQPVGQLSFEVYGNDNQLANFGSPSVDYESNWLMTLQVSEN